MASQKSINSAWEKASIIRGQNPDTYRRDSCGNKIRKASYGTHGEFGWELDHKHPCSKGGTNNPRNIQPLHWEENRQKGDKYPY